MFLKKIEMQGFKSFPEKIKLDFKKGITAIVGPNGSGKSNILDAIRWVIGEQSAKNLRGEKMEDIIFAGTKNRTHLSFAEVSIILDNTDKALKIDFEEVTVTRKVYRSGESAYYINGAACRLRDVHELFMDTGIGKEGYSIIGQGKIDAILNNKTDDRRALFEEAVGIVKFRSRKVQAENKLNEAKQNLTRTNDIISEIENQLEPLQKQAEKTKKYLKLYQNLKDISINLFVLQYQIADKKIAQIELSVKENLEQKNATENEKTEIIDKQNKLKINFYQKEKELDEISTSINLVINEINQNENQINLNLQNLQFIKKDTQRIENEINQNDANIQKKGSEIVSINSSLDAKKLELYVKKEKLAELEKQFEEKNLKINNNENFIEEYDLKISKKIDDISNLKEKLAYFSLIKNQFKDKIEQNLANIQLNKASLNEREARKEVLEIKLLSLLKSEENLNLDITNNAKYIQKIASEKEELIDKKESLKSQLIAFQNRKKILLELEKEFDGYNNSVKSILKEKSKLSGICGAIGELIEVPKEFETATEIALGSYLQNIITKTDEDAKIAIEYLKTNKKGRATFLPISSIKPKNISHKKEDLEKEKGFIGIANELIKFNYEYTSIFANILGRVLIFSDIDNAISFSKKYKYAYKIVTISGEIINPSGSLTGGSVYKKDGGIFSRSRKIQELENEINNLKQELELLENEFYSKAQKSEKLGLLTDKLEEDLQNISIKKIDTKRKISETENYLLQTKETLKAQENEIKTTESKIKENEIDAKNHQKDLKDAEIKLELLKKEIYVFKKESSSNRTILEEKIKTINDFKIEINSFEHEINSREHEIFRIQNEIKDLEQKNMYLNDEISKGSLKIENLTRKNKEISDTLKDLQEKNQNILDKQKNIQEEKISINANIEGYTKEILDLTNKLSNISNEKTILETKLQNIEAKMYHLSDSIWEEYEITYATAYEKYKDSEASFDLLQKNEKEIKKEIALLGKVNVLAVDEYNALKERYELSIAQRDDILLAEKNLRDIIKKLLIQMEEQFKSKFEIINQNFNQVFTQIFGGGTAKLSLADQKNVLTSGIDIVAKPPGKSLQSLTLLSGGERTLTAISLLFAILKLKPSPFSILDETEAALDDANVNRYANFLKKISLENQFILITHKTGTMEIADTLYGVTMEEQGISKLISVKLNEAKNNL